MNKNNLKNSNSMKKEERSENSNFLDEKSSKFLN